MNDDFADVVAGLCLKKFDGLPGKGKPIADKEWTLLSGVVQTSFDGGEVRSKVVSLATGTKCIGASKLSDKGTVINDSHAEVLARRGLLLYFLREAESAFADRPSSIFVRAAAAQSGDEDTARPWPDPAVCGAASADRPCGDKSPGPPPLTLRPGVTFHFFCSHTPCGDASIFPKDDANVHDDDDDVSTGKRPSDDGSPPHAKRRKADDDVGDDVHRTGAKCLADEIRQDPRLPGVAYHAVGAVRTKPGRGDRTLSVSCSDKLLRWHSSGIQGAVLSLIVGPVYLSSLTVGGGCPYSEPALRRAVIDRASSGDDGRPFPLRLMRSDLEFEHAKHRAAAAGCNRPCPSSVVWWESDGDGRHEVLVNGRKQGVTKKTMDRPSGASALCKKSLLDAFRRLPPDDHSTAACTYAQIKRKATSYRQRWTAVKGRLGCWTEKPKSLLEFT